MFRILRAKTLRELKKYCADWRALASDNLQMAVAFENEIFDLEERIDAARAAAGNDTSRASVKRMLAALDGEAARRVLATLSTDGPEVA